MDMHIFYKIKVGDYVKCYDKIRLYKVKSVVYSKQYLWPTKIQIVWLDIGSMSDLAEPVLATDISCIL